MTATCPHCGQPVDKPRIDGAGLTRPQSMLLAFISGYIAEHRCSPSYDEMRVHLKLASKSGVNRLLRALRDRGRITWLENQGRSVRLMEQGS